MPAEREAGRRLLHMVQYRGPWERLSGFFFGVRDDLTLRWEVRDGSLRDRLGVACDALDHRWHDRHLRRGTVPWRHWKRRPS